MPLPYGWASESTVIQSPASRAARRRSCQVRSVSIVEGPLEEAEGEPAGLELRSRGTAGRRRTGAASGDPCGSRSGSRARRRPGAASGRRGRPDAGRDPLLAGEVLRVGERPQARGQGGREAVGVVGELGEVGAEAPRPASRWAATKATARSVVALRAGASVTRRARIDRRLATSTAGSGSAGRRSARAGRACGRGWPRRRRRSPSRARCRSSASTMWPAVSTIRRRDRVIHPSARIGCRPGPAAGIDGHPGRDAPVVLADERPGHDLVEDRAQDPAVDDALPALEPAIERRARPTTARLDVQVEPEAAGVERPAGEAVVRRELEAAGRRLDRRSGGGRRRRLRRQGSAPCAPRS